MTGRRRQAITVMVGGAILFGILTTTLAGFYLANSQLQRARVSATEGRLAVTTQEDQERFTVITGILLGNVTATVANDGPIAVEVAYVAVLDPTSRAILGDNSTDGLARPILANSGGASLVVISDFRYPNTGAYEVVVVSKRGTVERGIFPPPFEADPSTIHLRQIGLLTIDILSFTFTSAPAGSCTGSLAWGAWDEGFLVPDDRCVVWRVNVTNNDPDRDFYIDANMHLFLMQAKSSSTRSIFLVNATLQGLPAEETYQTFDVTAPLASVSAYAAGDQIIPHRTWRWVYFFASEAGGAGQNPRGITPDQFAVWLLLAGWWEGVNGDPYGQNVPFIAVRGV